MSHQSSNTRSRPFLWLNLTQFLGALNDNLFKLLLIFFLIRLSGPEDAAGVAALAGGIFVVPFLVFSPFAGLLADRISKSRIIVAAKVLEVAVMVIGALAFWNASAAGLYLALFLMAVQSTFFSPAKYGILPEIVVREDLSRANGSVEALTYLAIILGTGLASVLPRMTGNRFELAALVCVGISLLGLATSLGIGPTLPESSGGQERRSPVEDLRHSLRTIRRDGYLTLGVVGASTFMFIGAFVQLNLIPFGITELGYTQEQSGALFLLVALGIGVGSLVAGRLSGRNVELGVVPLGALIIAAAALLNGLFPHQPGLVHPAIFLLGVGGGFFIVPLHAFIQFRTPHEERGKVLAAMNLLSWTGVLAAAILTHLLGEVWAAPANYGFVGLGLLALILTAITLKILPDFLLRFLALVMMRVVYRVKTTGSENVPIEGGALLVANHVSWVDALLLVATQQRRIRFMMERSIYKNRLLNPLVRMMGVIPVSSADSRKDIAASLLEARRALDEGWLVCIFAEGQITRNATLQQFRPGFEKIVEGSAHPVIPVHLGGVWGSLFSYAHGPLFSRLRFNWPEPVRISFGAPLESTAGAAEVRQAVMELACDDFNGRQKRGRTLARTLTKAARKNWRRRAVADTSGQELTFGQTLAGSLALGRLLERSLCGQEMVGVLLPPSVGGALANLALTLRGKVPVNLNYTASAEGFASAIRQAKLKTVLTSRRFLERLGDLPLPEEVLCLEDLLPQLGRKEKLAAWLKARFLPAPWLLCRAAKDPGDLATVIFSSGSTGEPKGVMLSHHNILSNIEALQMVLAVHRRDNICGALPFFHSFGYTGTLWLPLLSGFSAVYHPNPLEPAKIARAVRRHRSTFLLATPTFLQSYLRKVAPEDFATLRMVVTGAEKLQPALAEAFAEKFGLTPLEGYGATELSPVAAINLPDVELGGVRQTGTRLESVGRPLPGIAVRLVDPETLQPIPPDREGMVHIKGPNVMLGYLGRPEKTAEVLRDGWYVSGDIGRLDPKGFLHITGRLSRFSKIAGEMVPHGVVEEALQKGLELTEPAVAVTALPDERKGEKLVLIHTPQAGGKERLLKVLEESGLPNLWKPAPGSFLEVESLPLLGSGKLDLQALKKLAEERLAACPLRSA